eukprot:130038-Hanusia_phi.AAC.3
MVGRPRQNPQQDEEGEKERGLLLAVEGDRRAPQQWSQTDQQEGEGEGWKEEALCEKGERRRDELGGGSVRMRRR